jgi:hypothetical protein
LGYCLLLGETLVFEFVLVSLFSAVLNSDFSSTFIALSSFGWLLLFPSGGRNRLVLGSVWICDFKKCDLKCTI